MKTSLKATIAALALTAGAVAAMPASAQSFSLGFGPAGGIGFSYDSGGYCDQFGCPDDFWDMPVYYGPVFWHDEWYDGPVYYRDWYGRRQFWIHGDWRFDEWRGPHPSWWREGRYGPALGVDFYRSHGFHGRWDRGGSGYNGRDNGRGFDQRDNGRGFDQRDNGRGFDQRDNGRGFNQRDDRGNQRDSNQGGGGFNRPDDRGGNRDAPRALDQRGPTPQAQPQRGANPAPAGFQPRADGRGYGHYDRPATAPAAAPAPAAPANGWDDRHRRDDH